MTLSMKRRTFSLVLVPGALHTTTSLAQPGKPLPEIGILDPYPSADPFNGEFRQIFAEAGFVDGQNIRLQWRYADGLIARLPTLAADLAKLKLAAAIAIGDPAIRAARTALPATPIVAASDDLVGEGHVESLGRSNRNITGVSILASELNAKRLEFLKLAAPAAARIGVLWDPDTGTFHLDPLRQVAAKLQVELKIEEVRQPADVERAFANLSSWRAEALNVLASPLLHALRQSFIERANRARLPAIYQWPETAAAGGLMSYGPTHREALQAMARQLGRVLQGTKPGDIPVEQPTKFGLVLNLQTARAIGLTLPPSLVATADQVIE